MNTYPEGCEDNARFSGGTYSCVDQLLLDSTKEWFEVGRWFPCSCAHILYGTKGIIGKVQLLESLPYCGIGKLPWLVCK